MRRRVWQAVAALFTVAVITGLSGCASSADQITTPLTVDKNMTVVESYEQILTMYHALQQAVDPKATWEDEGTAWFIACGYPTTPQSGQLMFSAGWHNAVPTPEEETAQKFVAVLKSEGFDVRVQKDTAGRAIVAYPHGFLGGREPDGFGFEIGSFNTTSGYIGIDGHCAAGKTNENSNDLVPPGTPASLPPLFPSATPAPTSPTTLGSVTPTRQTSIPSP